MHNLLANVQSPMVRYLSTRCCASNLDFSPTVVTLFCPSGALHRSSECRFGSENERRQAHQGFVHYILQQFSLHHAKNKSWPFSWHIFNMWVAAPEFDTIWHVLLNPLDSSRCSVHSVTTAESRSFRSYLKKWRWIISLECAQSVHPKICKIEIGVFWTHECDMWLGY